MDQIEKGRVFSYQYSAVRNREVEAIRRRYLPRRESTLDRLRRLDRRVQTAGMVEGLTLGILGCLIFGVGMCFGLDALAGADWLSVVLGGIGILIMLPAYPIYRWIASRTRERYTPEILRLSDELIGDEKNQD